MVPPAVTAFVAVAFPASGTCFFSASAHVYSVQQVFVFLINHFSACGEQCLVCSETAQAMGGLFLGSPPGLSLFLVLPEAAQWHFVLLFETCTAIPQHPSDLFSIQSCQDPSTAAAIGAFPSLVGISWLTDCSNGALEDSSHTC